MTYFEACNKAVELTVVTDELTAVSYLQPFYRVLLRDNDVHLPGYDPVANDNDPELWEIVYLEVAKRNAMLNHVEPVAEWVYSAIAGVIDPAMTQEENELVKNVLEYMKTKEKKKSRGRKKKEEQIEEVPNDTESTENK